MTWSLVAVLVAGWALTLATTKKDRTIYSDQATHVMIAASVSNDWDLKYSLDDLRRFREDYPKEKGPIGLFLKQGASGDLYYSKPYIYGLSAAPFYALWGLNGFVVFNALCLSTIGAVVGLALRGALGVRWSIVASIAFILPSAFLPWVYVAHPDLFIAALLAVGGYILLSEKATQRVQFVATIILGAVLHEKITFLIVIPFVILAMPAVGWGRRALVGFFIFTSWGLFSIANFVVDGSLLAYQGMRLYAHGIPFPLEDGWKPPTKGITNHVFDPVVVVFAIVGNLSLLPEKFIDFLFGRQTGIVPYFPLAFGLLMVRASFMWGRSALVLLGFFAYMVLNWLVFPTNGYGGTGSYGSRYMMQALPLIPLAFLGIDRQSCGVRAIVSRRIDLYLLIGAAVFGVLIQHRVFVFGNEAVMRYWLVNIAPPLNVFRLEKWLLPTTFVGASVKYVENAQGGDFRIYNINEINRENLLWARRGPVDSNFVVYKADANAKLPYLSVEVPINAGVNVINNGRVIWSGALKAGQMQTLALDELLKFHSAYDVFLNSNVAWTNLVIESKSEEGGHEAEREPVASLRFDAALPRFEGMGKRVSPAELEALGGVLRKGWSYIEPWGVWSDGDIAEISLRVGEGGRKFLVQLGAHAYVPLGRAALDVEFRCSGGKSERVPFSDGSFKLIEMVCEKQPYHEHLTVTAVVFNPTSPLVEGRGTDPRRLGVGLNTFKIERIE